MSRSGQNSKTRLTREDWANAALRAIAREGLRAVAVEPMAKRLGVTKGSFYWHFKTRADLIQAAVELWEELGDRAIAKHLESFQEPRARLRALFMAAFESKNAHALLHHLASSQSSPIIQPVIQRVTMRRVASLTEMYAQCGLSEDQAKHRALLAYATYVGMFQIRATSPETTPTAQSTVDFTQHIVDTLVPK